MLTNYIIEREKLSLTSYSTLVLSYFARTILIVDISLLNKMSCENMVLQITSKRIEIYLIDLLMFDIWQFF